MGRTAFIIIEKKQQFGVEHGCPQMQFLVFSACLKVNPKCFHTFILFVILFCFYWMKKEASDMTIKHRQKFVARDVFKQLANLAIPNVRVLFS